MLTALSVRQARGKGKGVTCCAQINAAFQIKHLESRHLRYLGGTIIVKCWAVPHVQLGERCGTLLTTNNPSIT
jgi:hypothetical protein